MKLTSYLIPRDLNLSALLKGHGLSHIDKAIIRDKFYYLIDNLHVKTVIRENRNYEEYHNLSMVYLQNVLGTKFARQVIDALLKIGIVETDGKFAPCIKSYGYRLAQEYVSRGFEGVSPYDPKLIKRIIANREKRNDEVAGKSPVYRRVRETMAKILFDTKGAEAFVQENLFSSEGKRLKRAIYIRIFENREFCFGEDNYGRFHYPLTNLSRDLRKFITLDGQHLWSVDASCSQLFLIGCLGYPAPSLESQKFFDFCRKGNLYDFINSKLSVPHNLEDPEAKAALKRDIFHRIAYGSNYGGGPATELYRIFNQEFPELAVFIKREKKYKHADFAHKLQRFESKVILEVAALAFVSKYPAAPLLTIHDCLLTTQKWVPPLKECMLLAFAKECGTAPNLKESLFNK